MPTTGYTITARRYDFDWLRIGALALLILTHTAYVYRTTGWRVQSVHAGLWGDLLIEAMAPWRISIVFFIAGAATRFMLEKHDFKGFVRNRATRLFVPFILAVIVLIPPMQYIAQPENRGASYFDFMLHTGLHSREVLGFWVPDLGHVWFLPYVLLYALTAGLVWRFARPLFEAADRRINVAPVAWLIGAAAAFFVIADAILTPAFGRSNMLVDDPASHVRCMPVFILGVMLARPGAFWTKLHEARVWLMPLAAVLFLIALTLAAAQTVAPSIPHLARWAGLADGVYGAAMVFVILALANRMLGKPSRELSYFGDAIMPIYLMHQPVIVFAAAALRGAGLPLWSEFGLVFGLACGFPLFLYHFLIRPTSFLRVLFGLKAVRLAADEVTASSPTLLPSTGRSAPASRARPAGEA